MNRDFSVRGLRMSPLNVGLDEGLSKTKPVVVEADGQVLLDA